jgi:hypothetical protein
MTSPAGRGKYAEGKVREQLLKESQRRAGFDFERNYDARSSMGRIPRRAGDFTIYGYDIGIGGPTAAGHGVIEVKEVEHDFRLPKKNFNPDGFGILRKRELAGGLVAIIVYHRTTKLWRSVPFQFFWENAGEPSWDLTQFFGYSSAKAALQAAGVVAHHV